MEVSQLEQAGQGGSWQESSHGDGSELEGCGVVDRA